MPSPVSEDQIRGVYRETIDALYGAVSRKCDGDRDLAEDVVQETWLRAVRDWKVNGLPRSPIAWLTTVSRNLLLNEFRRRTAVPLDSIGPGEIAGVQAPNGDVHPDDASATVGRAMSQLSPDQAAGTRACEAGVSESDDCIQPGLTQESLAGDGVMSRHSNRSMAVAGTQSSLRPICGANGSVRSRFPVTTPERSEMSVARTTSKFRWPHYPKLEKHAFSAAC
jgi:hypothetical protein